MAAIIRDALLSTEKGKTLVIQARAIPARISTLDQLVYESFPYHIYRKARNRIKSVCYAGGEAYEEAEQVVLNSRDSQVDWAIAVDYLTRS